MPDSATKLDFRRARSAIAAAELTDDPSERYLAAQFAALQVAAVVLAWRGNAVRAASRSRPRNTWRMLAEVAPEFTGWAAFFAATHPKREAVRLGATTIVSAREADDIVQGVQRFLSDVTHSSHVVGESAGARAADQGRDTPRI
jgi:HEPN superfamily protein